MKIPSSLAATALRLDARSRVGLQRQICERLIDGIVNGVFAPGIKLPSSRELAKQLGVLEYDHGTESCIAVILPFAIRKEMRDVSLAGEISIAAICCTAKVYGWTKAIRSVADVFDVAINR